MDFSLGFKDKNFLSKKFVKQKCVQKIILDFVPIKKNL